MTVIDDGQEGDDYLNVKSILHPLHLDANAWVVVYVSIPLYVFVDVKLMLICNSAGCCLYTNKLYFQDFQGYIKSCNITLGKALD